MWKASRNTLHVLNANLFHRIEFCPPVMTLMSGAQYRLADGFLYVVTKYTFPELQVFGNRALYPVMPATPNINCNIIIISTILNLVVDRRNLFSFRYCKILFSNIVKRNNHCIFSEVQ